MDIIAADTDAPVRKSVRRSLPASLEVVVEVAEAWLPAVPAVSWDWVNGTGACEDEIGLVLELTMMSLLPILLRRIGIGELWNTCVEGRLPEGVVIPASYAAKYVRLGTSVQK
jgi:hypothetical protein